MEERKHKQIDLIKNSIHFDKICEQLPKYDRAFLLDNLDYLQDNKLVYCSMESENSKFHALSNGNHAFNERRFLRDGVKDQMNYIYDIVKNISVVVLLIIGISTFFINIYQTRKNSSTIEKLEDKIRSLEDTLIFKKIISRP